jgi:SpoVK/Ycf46/Vps4 family AAA+-type ATPase
MSVQAFESTVSNPLQVSSSDLHIDQKKIEEQLTTIFRQAYRWKAVLLLDEADVFLRARSLNSGSDDDITAFLRKPEHNEGLVFLTTNRVQVFDPAMQSRINLAVFYPSLSVDTRKRI